MIAKGMDSNGPVVVAVDGSEHSLKALDWALLAARAVGAEVVAAHVLPGHAQFWQARRTSMVGAAEEPAADPVAGVVRAHLEGRADLPQVRYESLEGELPGALDAPAAGARMLVLGSRGRGGFASLLLGSTSRASATTAPCPVVVVPHSAREAGREGEGRVVLGLNPSETADEVIEFAFRQAADLGLKIMPLTAFLDPVAPLPLIGAPMPGGLPDEDLAPLLREIERAQQERLEPIAARYPGVVVESLVGPGDAAGQLVAQSKTADLLVVGRHRTRLRADSLLMGSVANAALLHAQCPVAVVPAPKR
ncbi:universal stress protein [Streptomyces sp. NPDC089919]|uniref:universal stress protein n=1 Tax=Streptomyces sp. NPDC089919 TaxID=3155188 RepID=UPI003445BC02